MILLPEDILELIKLWRRSGKDFIGHYVNKTWKSGADLVKSVLKEKSNRERKVSFTNLYIILYLYINLYI